MKNGFKEIVITIMSQILLKLNLMIMRLGSKDIVLKESQIPNMPLHTKHGSSEIVTIEIFQMYQKLIFMTMILGSKGTV